MTQRLKVSRVRRQLFRGGERGIENVCHIPPSRKFLVRTDPRKNPKKVELKDTMRSVVIFIIILHETRQFMKVSQTRD